MEKKHPLWYRIRGLKEMEERFGDTSIQKFIRERLGVEEVVRILELGFGEGRCLLELKSAFPERKVELYGINDLKKGDMHGRSDFCANARMFNLSVPTRSYPKPYFYDAGKGLHFKDNYFDAIISQVAFPYVGNKVTLLEEMWRVLKFQGKAFIHVDSKPKENFPDFMKWNMETPRFVIYDGNKVISARSYLGSIRQQGFEVECRAAYNSLSSRIITMTKNKRKKLDLKLEYDGNSTLYLTPLRGT